LSISVLAQVDFAPLSVPFGIDESTTAATVGWDPKYLFDLFACGLLGKLVLPDCKLCKEAGCFSRTPSPFDRT